MTNCFIGTTGFFSLKGSEFEYPKDIKKDKYLQYYSENLNAVEIHSSFYKTPNIQTLRSWYQQTPSNFKFFLKIPKKITHSLKLKDTYNLINEFSDFIYNELKEKLAGFLFQLPPSFYNNDDNLQLISKNIKNDYQNILEFRNSSWWQDDKILNKLKRKKLIMAGLSIPGNIPDVVINNNSKSIYYKLYGVPDKFDSKYYNNFLDELANDISALKKTAYIFFANTNGIGAIDNALYLRNKNNGLK